MAQQPEVQHELRQSSSPEVPKEDDVLKFSNSVVWRFVDKLAGHDFAQIGVKNGLNRQFYDRHEPLDGKTLKVKVEAACLIDDEDSGPGEITLAANLDVVELQPDLTEPMYGAYKDWHLEKGRSERTLQPLEAVEAWHISEYSFKRFLINGFVVSWSSGLYKHYELQDPEENVVFDERDAIKDNLGISVIEVPNPGDSITREDMLFLKNSLKSVIYPLRLR